MVRINSKVETAMIAGDDFGCEGLLAARAAQANCAILISGATGTGKGHLARWIHEHSPRALLPFVPVNCGAIPDSLIDSHLFGHAKGSFSGATAAHEGLVRAASGGTLLLDEISELPHAAQLRLLRLLEEREVQPVGHSRPVSVDVRIIAATNCDLLDAVAAGRFREDLYFRLDVVRLHLAPLCERAAEIPQLLARFNAEFAAMYRHDPLVFDRQAMIVLERYRWPGNIRELRSMVERLHVLCDSSHHIGPDELRSIGQLRDPSPLRLAPGGDRFLELKLDVVNEAIKVARGNVSRAAQTLGVHRSTLYRWLAGQRLTA